MNETIDEKIKKFFSEIDFGEFEEYFFTHRDEETRQHFNLTHGVYNKIKKHYNLRRSIEQMNASRKSKWNSKMEDIHAEWTANITKEALYDYFIVYLSLDREMLYERINKRVDKMVSDGLICEVKALYDEGIYPHAIGYQELVPYFDHDITLESAIEEIKKNTRHLAKRQETWFHHQMDSHFYKVDLENIENTINQIIKDVDGWLK